MVVGTIGDELEGDTRHLQPQENLQILVQRLDEMLAPLGIVHEVPENRVAEHQTDEHAHTVGGEERRQAVEHHAAAKTDQRQREDEQDVGAVTQAQQSQQRQHGVTGQHDVGAHRFHLWDEFITDKANGGQYPKHTEEGALDEYGLGDSHPSLVLPVLDCQPAG